jgi:hypothetical protein
MNIANPKLLNNFNSTIIPQYQLLNQTANPTQPFNTPTEQQPVSMELLDFIFLKFANYAKFAIK